MATNQIISDLLILLLICSLLGTNFIILYYSFLTHNKYKIKIKDNRHAIDKAESLYSLSSKVRLAEQQAP